MHGNEYNNSTNHIVFYGETHLYFIETNLSQGQIIHMYKICSHHCAITASNNYTFISNIIFRSTITQYEIKWKWEMHKSMIIALFHNWTVNKN